MNLRLLVLLTVGLSSMATASAGSPPVSTLLEPDHWATRAADRLERLGLAERHFPAQRAVPILQVHETLIAAVRTARRQAPHLQALAEDTVARFEATYPWLRRRREADSLAPTPSASPEAAGTSGAQRRELRVGFEASGVDADGPAAIEPLLPEHLPLPEGDATLGLRARARVGVGEHLAGYVDAALALEGARLGNWEVVAGLPGFTVSVGRQRFGYGPVGNRGLLLGATTALTRLELQTPEPFRLPGFLGHLGEATFHAFFHDLEEPRHPGAPLLWGFSGQLRPHPRLTLGLHRGAMLGGDGVGQVIDAVDFVLHALALSNGIENNIVSAGFRWRAPTEPWLPLTLWGEWAAEDSAGGHLEAPALVLGFDVPAIPGLPSLSVGADYSWMGLIQIRPDRRDLDWYTHYQLRGGWVAQETELGHPLAGNGEEWRLHARLGLFAERLSVGAELFTRFRDHENLQWPIRSGRSHGGEATLRAFPADGAQLTLAGSWDVGADWHHAAVRAALSLGF